MHSHNRINFYSLQPIVVTLKMPPRKISDIFQRSKADTPPFESPNTPNTQKRKHNYAKLNKYGLDGSPKSPSTQAPQKKSRPNPPLAPLQSS